MMISHLISLPIKGAKNQDIDQGSDEDESIKQRVLADFVLVAQLDPHQVEDCVVVRPEARGRISSHSRLRGHSSKTNTENKKIKDRL